MPDEHTPQTALPSALDLGADSEGALDVFPLSSMQESLWVLDQLTPGHSAYNLPEAWRLSGRLDLRALQVALETIFLRHESLRTVIGSLNGAPVQIVRPHRPLSLPLTDLSQNDLAEIRLRELLDTEARRPFNLASGPLARLHLYRMAPEEHVLLINLHHIISDEWSLNLFRSELIAHYRASLAGQPLRLPELPIQYADFAVWQRELIAGGGLKAQLEFWKSKLRGPLPALSLPTDYSPSSQSSYRGATLFSTLPPELLADLKNLARAQGATLFMVLAAAFKALLHRYTRQTDIIVGSPMAGRERIETEGLMGFFINTLALRTDLSGDPPFFKLVERVRETVLGACAHQEVPIDKVIEVVQPDRHPGRHPLFQVVFGLQPPVALDESLPDLKFTRVDLDNGGSKFDWTLLLTEMDEGLHIRCEYSIDLLERGTVSNRLQHFETLLRAAVGNPNRPLSKLPLLSEAERCRLIADSKAEIATPAPQPCLHDWFMRQAQLFPQATAVTFGSKSLSYRELNNRSNQLGHYLQELGVGPEAPVALYLERSVEMVVAILGVLKAGGAYVPIDPANPGERLNFILEDSGARVVLTQRALRDALPSAQHTVVCLDEHAKFESCAETPPVSGAEPHNAAYIIYTSGSTGRPKGVIVTHANASRLFTQTAHWFNFQPSDVWTLFHSCAFDFSVWEIWGALLYGGRLVIVPYLVSRSPSEFYRLLATEGVTVLNQTPSAFRQLIWAEQMMPQALDLKLRFIICGGEALELQTLRPWFEKHGDEQPRIVNMYGITETTVHVTYREIRQVDVSAGMGSVIGVPIPDLKMYLLDENLEPVPVGIPGEVCVGGPGVARGYLNRPELTAQRFVPNPFQRGFGERLYRSGDLARYTVKGELEYLGRMDHQVKIRGFRVELGEIESALNRHPAVRGSAVVSEASCTGSPRLIAYVVPIAMPPSEAQLRTFLQQVLPDYMVPSIFVPLESLPLTANGKLDRRALPAPAPTVETKGSVLPRTTLEKQIAAIWCEILARPSVGIFDNFFHLGGHSLLATQVMARLSAQLKLELSVGLLFEAPTVAALAEAAMSAQPAAMSAIPRRGPTVNPEELLAQLDQLSGAQIDELLRQSEGSTL